QPGFAADIRRVYTPLIDGGGTLYFSAALQDLSGDPDGESRIFSARASDGTPGWVTARLFTDCVRPVFALDGSLVFGCSAGPDRADYPPAMVALDTDGKLRWSTGANDRLY